MTSSMFISTVGLRKLGIPVAPLKVTTDKQDNRRVSGDFTISPHLALC